MKSIIPAVIVAVVALGLVFWFIDEEVQVVKAELATEEHIEYVLQCVGEVAAIDDFSCGDGEVVPITVDGVEITSATFEPDMTCDRPALLANGPDSDGQCVPGSRILNLSTEQTQVSAMCRQKHNRPADSLLFDEIDVIAHNSSTGATCWFQAKGSDADTPIDGTLVSSPTNLEGPHIWANPADVVADGCGDCHDNDPFMYSPFVGQVWDEVPANPLGPYYQVGAEFGFDDWPTTALDMRDNTCVGCHRIGIDHTCGNLTNWMTGIEIPAGADPLAQEFPMSHAMPPEHGQTHAAWSTFHSRSVAQIKSCCANPSQQMCNATEIPSYPLLE
jgi:hypothetical protein